MKADTCNGCPEYQKLLEKLRRDSLTGLLGREEFERRAHEVLSQSTVLQAGDSFEVTVCFMDMDDLKLINDRYGHRAGDAAIIHFAHTLTAHVRPSDVVARYSREKRDDEFGVLFPHTSLKDAREIVRRIRRELRSSKLLVNGIDLIVRSSFGTVSTAQGFYTFDMLFEEADRRMRRHKRWAKRWGRRAYD